MVDRQDEVVSGEQVMEHPTSMLLRVVSCVRRGWKGRWVTALPFSYLATWEPGCVAGRLGGWLGGRITTPACGGPCHVVMCSWS